MTESPLLESSIALAAYAEPLAANRRVLVFGSALGALAVQLLERGARAVHVCDSDALSVAEASARNRSSQVTFSALAESDLSVRDGAFELALIEDLGAFDALSVLRKAHRALVQRGVAVVACPNPEAAFPLLRAGNRAKTALDYYALYDAVAAEFEHVRMLGQTPFVGYAIADFSAAGEPEPVLDTSFVPGGAEEPDVFIALAAGHEIRLDEFAVIQLPTRQLLRAVSGPNKGDKADTPELPPVPEVDPRELSRLNDWIRELEARASTADERADQTEAELQDARSELDRERESLARERQDLEAQRVRFEQELTALRAEHAAKQARHEQELALERGDAAAKHSQTAQELVLLRGEGATKQSRHEQELTAVRADLNARQAELLGVRVELAQRDRQLTEQAARAEQETKSELADFERQLSERGLEVRRLEGDVRTLERTGRELLRELERSRSEQSTRASAELERALAEREADLQAAAWTIESLSLRLELAGGPRAAHDNEPKTPLADAEAR